MFLGSFASEASVTDSASGTASSVSGGTCIISKKWYNLKYGREQESEYYDACLGEFIGI